MGYVRIGTNQNNYLDFLIILVMIPDPNPTPGLIRPYTPAQLAQLCCLVVNRRPVKGSYMSPFFDDCNVPMVEWSVLRACSLETLVPNHWCALNV